MQSCGDAGHHSGLSRAYVRPQRRHSSRYREVSDFAQANGNRRSSIVEPTPAEKFTHEWCKPGLRE